MALVRKGTKFRYLKKYYKLLVKVEEVTFMKKIIDILLLAWSYSPLLSLTDDLDFSNASLNNKDRWSLRFSFLNLYFGEYLIQIITFNLSEKQPDLYRITKLSDFSNFIISQDKINHL